MKMVGDVVALQGQAVQLQEIVGGACPLGQLHIIYTLPIGSQAQIELLSVF